MSDPILTAAIPLHNDGQYIRDALQSLVAQTFKNFEIVICDDASIDESARICLEFAARDKRIRYYRNAGNIGEIGNFNKTLALARGKYFMWASGHDVWYPRYMECCVEALEANPRAVAVIPWKEDVDGAGKRIKIDRTKPDTQSQGQLRRFLTAIWTLSDSVMISVLRTENVRNTRGYQLVTGPDHIFRTELALQGEFIVIHEVLMKLRHQRDEDYKQAFIRRLKNWRLRERRGWFYAALPHWAMVYEITRGASRIVGRSWNATLYILLTVLVSSIRFYRLLFFFDFRALLNRSWRS